MLLLAEAWHPAVLTAWLDILQILLSMMNIRLEKLLLWHAK